VARVAGFLPWSDERVHGTVAAVESALLRDGLPGGEASFLACSFWLADALHGIGRTRDAERLFESLLALRNDVGLLSEEYDTAAGRQGGNTPQAFSMVGLVNTARHLGGATVTA